jgi:hypothetical protein
LTPPFEAGPDVRVGRTGNVGGVSMIAMRRFGAVASVGALLVLSGCSAETDAGDDPEVLGEVIEADPAGEVRVGGPWPDCELAAEFEPC